MYTSFIHNFIFIFRWNIIKLPEFNYSRFPFKNNAIQSLRCINAQSCLTNDITPPIQRDLFA